MDRPTKPSGRHAVRLRRDEIIARLSYRFNFLAIRREDELPDSDLPRDFRYFEKTPVFFGHYWLKDTPRVTASNAVCLDFSVAKKGYLTAYRWSGEHELVPISLMSVPASD